VLLEIAQIFITGTAFAIELCELPQAFLFIKTGLIAPARNGDIYTAVWAFGVTGETHYIGKAAISHEDFNPYKQVENILSPEVCVPAAASVETAEAVKFHNSLGVFPGKPYVSLNELRIGHIVKCEDIVAIVLAAEQCGTFLIVEQPLIETLLELKWSTGLLKLRKQSLPVRAAEEVVIQQAYLFPGGLKELAERTLKLYLSEVLVDTEGALSKATTGEETD